MMTLGYNTRFNQDVLNRSGDTKEPTCFCIFPSKPFHDAALRHRDIGLNATSEDSRA